MLLLEYIFNHWLNRIKLLLNKYDWKLTYYELLFYDSTGIPDPLYKLGVIVNLC